MPYKKIDGWENVEVIERLHAAGWTSTSIALYVKARYGMDVSASAIRYYVQRKQDEIEERWGEIRAGTAAATTVSQREELVDTVGTLGAAIRLQWSRIEKDVQMEQQFPKGFEGTRHEFDVLSRMVGQYHSMLQDYGVAPVAGQEVTVRHAEPEPEGHGAAVIDVVESEEEREQVIAFSRLVNREIESGGNGQRGNGQA